jgi:hypothetical protein
MTGPVGLDLTQENLPELPADQIPRPQAVDLMIDALLLVKLFNRYRQGFIGPEPFLDDIFTVVGPLHQSRAADVTQIGTARRRGGQVVDRGT